MRKIIECTRKGIAFPLIIPAKPASVADTYMK